MKYGTELQFERAFKFLVDNAEFLANTSYYYWSYDGNRGCLDAFSLKQFLCSPNPVKAMERTIKKFIKYTMRPKYPLEFDCQNGTFRFEKATLDFDIFQWLDEGIKQSYKFIHIDSNFNYAKKLVAFNKYSELLEKYKEKMVVNYNEKTEGELLELVKLRPSLISILSDPSFELHKAAWIANEKKLNSDHIYEKFFDNYIFNKTHGIEEEGYETDRIMAIEPMCSTKIVNRDVSVETFNKAIGIFPELIFYIKQHNSEHLVLNSNIYSFLEKEVEKATIDTQNYADMENLKKMIHVLQMNIALYSKGYIQLLTNEDYEKTINLLTKLYVIVHAIEIAEKEESIDAVYTKN